MAESIYKSRAIQKILAYRRKRRVSFVLSMFNMFPGMSILDVGCGPDGRSFENLVPNDLVITGIDLLDSRVVKIDHPNFTYYKQDASDLSRFADNAFDLTVSFGMMEHICDKEALFMMSSEIRRVSKQWAIIVPWRYALIEPHFKFPFFQLLPYQAQVFLTKHLDLHGLSGRISEDKDYIKKHYQWFSSHEWMRIFNGHKVAVSPFLDTIVISGASH